MTSNFIKIHPVGAQLFHVDGQTDMTKVTVAFCKFANLLKNKFSISIIMKLELSVQTRYRHSAKQNFI